MRKFVGLDVGGANLKATILGVQDFAVEYCTTVVKFFPIWREGKEKLVQAIGSIRVDLDAGEAPDAVGLSLTAELSDAFFTKREGSNYILDSVEKAFPNVPLHVLDVYCKLRSVADARKDPFSIAAANWPATGWLASQFFENCIVVDVGSTTTSIIPVIGRNVAVEGRNDFDKLASGELVYTGSLRSNVATIVRSLPLRGRVRQVSSELFALSGDVHLILGHIAQMNYGTETADGRGKSKAECLGRLARVVCADIEMLSERELVEMATYIYEQQLDRISAGLAQVKERIAATYEGDVPIVVTGMGRIFLAKRAAQKIGCDKILDLGDYVGDDAAVASTSVGAAWMVAAEREGRKVSWKR